MATKKIQTKSYVLQKEVGANDKCPPQMRLIIDTVKGAENGKISRDDLLTLLKRPADQGGLKTDQTAERILAFYRPKMKAAGFVLEVTEETEVEVPDEPAKTDATAAEGTPAAEGSAPAAPQTTKSKKKNAA